MSTEIDKTTIITFQGDTCEVTFTSLEPDSVIYFSVRDKKTNELVFPEMHDTVDNKGEITFTMTPDMTNKFVVKPSEGVNTYYHGLKQVNEITGEENTILLGDNPKLSDRYLLKVYLKKAEGIIENG